jgi:5-methylcytosine-specific restriction endonuclease McrA
MRFKVSFKGYKHTEETKRKISEACKNPSLQRRQKNSIDRIGKKHSKETILKMKESQLKRWENHIKITPKNKIERILFRNTMQAKIFERDNYTCQMCGSGGDLQVDHIQSWKDYVELRFSMDNCRTLCMDCHYLITYGKPKPKNIIWGHNLKHVTERSVL